MAATRTIMALFSRQQAADEVAWWLEDADFDLFRLAPPLYLRELRKELGWVALPGRSRRSLLRRCLDFWDPYPFVKPATLARLHVPPDAPGLTKASLHHFNVVLIEVDAEQEALIRVHLERVGAQEIEEFLEPAGT